MFKAISPSSSVWLTVNQELFLKAGPLTIGLINLIGGLLLGLVCIIGTFVRLDGNENVDKGVLLRQGILFIICAVIGRLFFFSSFNLSSFNSCFLFYSSTVLRSTGRLGGLLGETWLGVRLCPALRDLRHRRYLHFWNCWRRQPAFHAAASGVHGDYQEFFLFFVLCSQFLIYSKVSVNIYFAVCLFSYYYELKNKKKVEGGDVELATAGKNNSYPVYTVKPVWSYIVLLRSLFLHGTFSSENAINKCLDHIPKFLKQDRSGSQGVKKKACLQGPRGSRGGPTGSQGVKREVWKVF